MIAPLLLAALFLVGVVPPTIAAPAGETTMTDTDGCTVLFDFARADDRDA